MKPPPYPDIQHSAFKLVAPLLRKQVEGIKLTGGRRLTRVHKAILALRRQGKALPEQGLQCAVSWSFDGSELISSRYSRSVNALTVVVRTLPRALRAKANRTPGLLAFR